MLSVLDAVRDALVSLALAWIGVVVEPAPQATATRGGDAPAACSVAGQSSGACAKRTPTFDAQRCIDQP